MSHYSVLVIGDNVEAQLQPFHEFESTGVNDQYVREIDETEEKRKEYEESTQYTVIAPDGTTYYLFTSEGNYDVRFRKEGDYGRKETMIPEGWTEGKWPTNNRFTFAQWLDREGIPHLDPNEGASDRHKYGYYTADKHGQVIKVINRTNPDSHWDWWQEGGRWSNFWILKNGKYGTCARKDEFDFEGRRDQVGKNAGQDWDDFHKIRAGRPMVKWSEILEKHGEDIDAARAEYRGNPVISDLDRDEKFGHWFFHEDPDSFMCTREEYIQKERDSAIATFAVVKDGKWFSRGRMGWWGVVHDEKPEDDWNKEFSALIDSLPGDTILTIVDCHT